MYTIQHFINIHMYMHTTNMAIMFTVTHVKNIVVVEKLKNNLYQQNPDRKYSHWLLNIIISKYDNFGDGS